MKFEPENNAVFIESGVCSIVYFLLDGEDVVYVGQSKHGLYRPFSHRDKNFNRVAFITCEENKLDYFETQYIRKYRPKYNKSAGNFDFSFKRIKKFIRENTYLKDFTVIDIKRIIKMFNINTIKFGNLTYISDNDFNKMYNFVKATSNQGDNVDLWRKRVFE